MIDWKNRTLIGKSGRVYKIEPENISAGRWAEFEIQQLQLAYSMEFKAIHDNIAKVLNDLRNGNNLLKAHSDAIKTLECLHFAISNYTELPIPAILKFCSLFINYDGEDVGKYDPIEVRKKADDWANIPIKDFFLLASEVIPSFRETYNAFIQASQQTAK